MKMLPVCIVVGLLLVPTCIYGADRKSTALLHQAMKAQGGEQTLRSLKSVQWESFGYRNELEESERPEGPYITEFDTLVEIHDFAGNRYRSVTDGVVYPVFKSSSGSVVDGNVVMRVSGTTKSAGTPQQLEVIREREALSPERLLLTALDASDAHTEPDTVLQSVPQNVVAFNLDDAPVRIYLNAFTHLPTAVDYSGPLARSGFSSQLWTRPMPTQSRIRFCNLSLKTWWHSRWTTLRCASTSTHSLICLPPSITPAHWHGAATGSSLAT